MGALQYAGSSSTNPTDVASKRTIDTTITGTIPNQQSVRADILAAVANLCTKEYVDVQDSRYAPLSEYTTKDTNRNVLKTAVNTPNNPASLPIPSSRFAALGSGFVMGPYGWQSIDAPTSSGTVAQVASLTTDAIPKDKKFWPIAFGQVMVVSSDIACLPVIEIKSGGGLLLATGRGRSMWTGPQGVTALPVAGGEWPVSNGSPLTVTMTLSDFTGRTVTAKDGTAIAIGGAVYILVAS